MLELLVILFTALFLSGIFALITFIWYGFIAVVCIAVIAQFWKILTGDKDES